MLAKVQTQVKISEENQWKRTDVTIKLLKGNVVRRN